MTLTSLLLPLSQCYGHFLEIQLFYGGIVIIISKWDDTGEFRYLSSELKIISW